MKHLTKNTIEELELLFEFVPLEKLRKRLEFLFFNYLSNNELTHDIKEMSKDVYFLMKFLEKVEKKEG